MCVCGVGDEAVSVYLVDLGCPVFSTRAKGQVACLYVGLFSGRLNSTCCSDFVLQRTNVLLPKVLDEC